VPASATAIPNVVILTIVLFIHTLIAATVPAAKL
jgi:hypothetical protein